MGLSQDGPIGPSQHANPQDSPPMAPVTPPEHPTRADKLNRHRELPGAAALTLGCVWLSC